jgi:hypothetical protein
MLKQAVHTVTTRLYLLKRAKDFNQDSVVV